MSTLLFFSSGIEEPYSEKDCLINELKDMASEGKELKKMKTQIRRKQIKSANEGKTSRENVATEFFEYHLVAQNHDLESQLPEKVPGEFCLNILQIER